ncbi:MAG: hypothetical protein HYT20_02640 [Candidatus Nealsonbacteria bacterium]|nr:hypothetical protein [Candidatus Nealsonbacteria bacterium]
MINIKHYAKEHGSRNIPLTFEEAYDLGVYMIHGCRGNNLAQIQSIAILSLLHTKATYLWKFDERTEKRHGHRLPISAAEQIAGICAAIFEHDIAESQFGFLNPNIPYAMDNSGMGGDLIVTANVSTIAAFIAAMAGVPMCKHGSPANADAARHGSSDFVELCGINTTASQKEVESCVEKLRFGYTEAIDTRYKLIHLQTHRVAQLPHMNDIIGPITNPLNPKILRRRMLGVNHLIPPVIAAQAYRIMNERGITFVEHGFFLRGFGDNGEDSGMDELSICKGGTQIAELKNGKIKEYYLYPYDFGLITASENSISPPEGMGKGKFSLSILKREITGAPARMIAANAALLLYLAGKSDDLSECYREASEILSSGQAYEKMLAVKKALPK